ncbi:MAG: outer membrane beta-barrel protein [Gallionella sp.]|nr:outer membrane beta-barrel protein [Gallionella sp.]
MKKLFRFDRALFALLGILMVSAASAAEPDSAVPVFHFGGLSAYPGLGVVLKHDSNIFRVSDSSTSLIQKKTASTITVISPSVSVHTNKDIYAYSLDYIASIGRYSNSSADNYTDQSFLGYAEIGLSTRSTLKITPEYLIGHDDRGAITSSAAFSATPVPSKWTSTRVSSSLAYGADEARGKALLEVGYNEQQYQNNRDTTKDYDKSLTNLGGTFYFRVQPKTWLLVNAKHTNISYKSGTFLSSLSNTLQPSLSGSEQRIMAGLKWEVTAQSSGEVKLGQMQKNFDSATYATNNSISWEGDVSWNPVGFVEVDFFTSKRPNETALHGSRTILVSTTGANVAYDLNDRVTLLASAYHLNEDFVGVSRVDNTNNFGLKAEYKFRSWLVGEAEYTNSAKTSNAPQSDYKRNILMFGLRSVL